MMPIQARLAAALFILIALIGSHWYVFSLGKRVERETWQAKENVRLSDTAKLAIKAAEDNARIQQENEAKARKVTASHENELTAIRTEYKRNTDRLRLPSSICRNITVTAEATSASGSDGTPSASVVLPEEIGRNLRDAAKEADEVTARARGLQDFSRDNGFYGDVNNR